MDLSLAIAKLDPKAEYRLNHSQDDGAQIILEWRGPGTQPKQAELDLAWELCLQDKAAEDLREQERLDAIARVKASATLSDVALVLRL